MHPVFKRGYWLRVTRYGLRVTRSSLRVGAQHHTNADCGITTNDYHPAFG